MKVLMFGWEFPPHISGGLGTACFGLTQSLTQGGTQILFVVPRAYGDEALRLINASEILISEPDKTIVAPASTSTLTQTGMEVINIPSNLKPYLSAKRNANAKTSANSSFIFSLLTSSTSFHRNNSSSSPASTFIAKARSLGL